MLPLLLLVAAPAFAVPVIWTDWQSVTSASSASGSLSIGATTVSVDYSGTGNHNFVQTNRRHHLVESRER